MNRNILILSFLITSLFAFGTAPKYSNDFLNIGVSARGIAMGGASISSVTDYSSGYYNPASLLRIEKSFDAGIMHSNYYSGIAAYDYFGIANKLDSSHAIGFSAIRLGIDNIQNTLNLFDASGNIDYNRIEYFSAADYAFIFSYAQKSPLPNLNLGANFKIIRRIIGDFANAWGFGLDAGATYRLGKWNFAAVGKDITGTFNAWSFNTDKLKNTYEATGNEMPTNSVEITIPRLILGVSRGFSINKYYYLTSEINLVSFLDGKRNSLLRSQLLSIDPLAAIEFDYRKIVFLRGGVSNIQRTTDFDKTNFTIQPNLGIGLHLWNFRIDYALANVGEQSVAPYSHIFSLGYMFDLKK